MSHRILCMSATIIYVNECSTAGRLLIRGRVRERNTSQGGWLGFRDPTAYST